MVPPCCHIPAPYGAALLPHTGAIWCRPAATYRRHTVPPALDVRTPPHVRARGAMRVLPLMRADRSCASALTAGVAISDSFWGPYINGVGTDRRRRARATAAGESAAGRPAGAMGAGEDSARGPQESLEAASSVCWGRTAHLEGQHEPAAGDGGEAARHVSEEPRRESEAWGGRGRGGGGGIFDVSRQTADWARRWFTGPLVGRSSSLTCVLRPFKGRPWLTDTPATCAPRPRIGVEQSLNHIYLDLTLRWGPGARCRHTPRDHTAVAPPRSHLVPRGPCPPAWRSP